LINFIEVEQIELNFRQRWSSYLTIIVAVVVIVGGFVLRTRALTATQRFEDKEAGIAARYPVNWLVDQNGHDFIFRAQDPAALSFKTTLQIAIVTVGPDAHTTDLPDILNPVRAASLPAYRPLTITPIKFANGTEALQMAYAYVSSESNPFLQSVPIVVQAIDVIVLRRNQALVVTYRADEKFFERYRPVFDTFLRSLEF
jgi:hypothetical protein